jgi:hypothetical protein
LQGNAYTYVFNNPTNKVDPTGMSAERLGWGAFGGFTERDRGPLRDVSGQPIMLADGGTVAADSYNPTADALAANRGGGRTLLDGGRPLRNRELSWFEAALPATASALGSDIPPGYIRFRQDMADPFTEYMARLQVTSLAALGGFQAGFGAMASAESLGGFAVGGAAVAHSADNLQAAIRNQPAYTEMAIEHLTGNRTLATAGNVAIGLGLDGAATYTLSSPPTGPTPTFVNRFANSAFSAARASAFRLAIDGASVEAPYMPQPPAYVGRPIHRVQINNASGKSFETLATDYLSLARPAGYPQLAIRPILDNGSVGSRFFRVDYFDPGDFSLKPGTTGSFELKSSIDAHLTPNQRWGYPLFLRNGGVVTGEMGGIKLPPGTILPPTPTRVIRFDRFGSNPIRGDEP